MGANLAEVLRRFGPAYLHDHSLSTPQARAWRAIVACRTAALGGHATLFRHGERSGDVFHPLPAPIRALQHNLKRAFDPAGVFNPGRLYEGL